MASPPPSASSSPAPGTAARPRLRTAALWLLAGQGAQALAQWAMLAVVAKTLGPAMLGQWGFATSLMGPISTLTALNLRGLLATDAARQHPLAQYARVRLLGTLLAAGLTLGAIAAQWWTQGPELVPLFLTLLFVQRTVEAAADVTYGALQRAGDPVRVGQSFLWRAALGLGLFVTLLTLTHSLPVALSGQALATALVLQWRDTPRLRALEPQWPRLRDLPWPHSWAALRATWADTQPLVRLGLTYSALALIPNLIANMPRWWLGRADVAALGYFTALIYGPTALSLVAGAVAQTVAPALAAAQQRQDAATVNRLLGRAAGLLASVGTAAVLTALVAGPQILTLLYQADYARYAPQLAVLLLAGTIQMIGSVAGTTLSAWRQVRIQRWVSLGLLALTAAVAPFAVSRWGVNGAIATVCLSSLAHALANWTVVLRVRPRRPRPPGTLIDL